MLLNILYLPCMPPVLRLCIAPKTQLQIIVSHYLSQMGAWPTPPLLMEEVTMSLEPLLLIHAVRGSVWREHRPGRALIVLMDPELDLGMEWYPLVNVSYSYMFSEHSYIP